ncbi:hypothetical protein [Hymenobacter yonginensis]|uniref:Uncharacterized protein n=1 Tax=Hymenobacter yonginensis TaxID=748197 RepID=A0ABY7PN28_9BACT|nr:hypothetical protein [Hymenobacter yonginensis]WBO84037.1 hypothetical protein O9Z63_16865 [Hymenobacter yonginensis]
MKKTFEDESDALSTSPATPTAHQDAAVTPPNHENQESTSTRISATAETPVPTAGNGAPDYSQVELKTEPELPTPDKAGGSATEPESGGGYSG